MSYIDQVIKKCVNNIWGRYDLDGSNELDKTETKWFITDILAEMGDKDGFSEEVFEDTFNFFDVDKSGLISKSEIHCPAWGHGTKYFGRGVLREQAGSPAGRALLFAQVHKDEDDEDGIEVLNWKGI